MPKEPSALLVVEKGIPDLRVFPLEQQVCLLGASSSADVFIDNSYVSRMHAQIVEEAEGHRIRDLDSKNGTFVNGTRVASGGQVLVSGDRIELAEGQVVLRFQLRGVTISHPATPAVAHVEIVVDSRSREVWVRGERLVPPVSRKEFDILSLLYERLGEACSKDEIAVAGWPERTGGEVGDQEIEQSIRRIRLRIELEPSKPEYIINVRGYGYKLQLA
jgi:DNA-binding winged helix-turn-helix (wHTH) protein